MIDSDEIGSINVKVSPERFYINGQNGTFTIEPSRTTSPSFIQIWNTLQKRYGTLVEVIADGDANDKESILLDLSNMQTNTFDYPYAILCRNGIFGGLRPQTRVITSNTTLTKLDFTVIVTSTSVSYINLPANPEDGQTYFIFNAKNTNLRIYPQTVSYIYSMPSKVNEANANLAASETAILVYSEDAKKWFLGVMLLPS